MQTLIQIGIQSALLGGLYALIAAGFTLIFSVGRVLNLAHGAWLMLGAYSYFWVVQVQGLPRVIGIAAALTVGTTVAILMYQLLMRRLKGNHVAVEISTLVLAVIFQAGIVLLFNDSAKIMHPIVLGVFRIGGATVTFNMLTATLASWVILAGLYYFVLRTSGGRAMSAVSMDAKGAAICGIDPDHTNRLTWAISGALAAIAGVFFASYTQLNPTMWVAPLIIAVAIVIVGGVGSIIGTLVVAHLIGALEVTTSTLLAAELRGVFTMLLVIIVLLVLPRGLFGRHDG